MSKDKLPKKNTSSGGNSNKNSNSDRVSWFKRFKAFLGRKKRSIFAVLFFVLVLGVAFYFVMPFVMESKNGFQENENVVNSPFEDVGITPSQELDEYKKIINEGVDYWMDWSWEKDYAFFQVKDIDQINTEIVVYIGQPRFRNFSEKDILVNVKCSEGNTIAIDSVSSGDKLADVVERKFDIFDRMEVGNLLIARCLDEDCISIGGQCILVVNDNQYSSAN